MHYTARTHFFRDENDDRTVVITTLLPDSKGYEAELIEHPVLENVQVYGHGGTRLEAIADLQQHISLELNR